MVFFKTHFTLYLKLRMYSKRAYFQKLPPGLAVSTVCWIRHTLRIIFLLLQVFLNINRPHGLHFTLICKYWSSFFQVTFFSNWSTILYKTILISAGMYFCFKKLTDANIFIIMYGVTSIYFAVSLIVSVYTFYCICLYKGALPSFFNFRGSFWFQLENFF